MISPKCVVSCRAVPLVMIAYAGTLTTPPVEKLCFTAVDCRDAVVRTSIEIDYDRLSVGAVVIATGARDSCSSFLAVSPAANAAVVAASSWRSAPASPLPCRPPFRGLFLRSRHSNEMIIFTSASTHQIFARAQIGDSDRRLFIHCGLRRIA